MATPLVIEEERGTCTGNYHPHNGYYAGDFSATRAASPGAGYARTADVVALPFAPGHSLRPHRSAA
jgi:hypothetical protein